jgi:nucleotide-binding universal stress UspA family protein
MTADAHSAAPGPVVFAYDGSELSKLAIDEAGKLLGPGRTAVVVTGWQPVDVGFVPASGLRFDTQDVGNVKEAAQQTAEAGASLAEAAGFRAHGEAIQAGPSWKAIVKFADDRDADLIVLGSHGRHGIADLVLGSVAGAVASHSRRSVLIVHRRP